MIYLKEIVFNIYLSVDISSSVQYSMTMVIRIRILLSILLLLVITPLLFAETSSVGSTSIQLNGTVGPRSIFEVTQLIGANPGIADAIPLDSGDILFNSSDKGVEVGTWSAFSNSTSNLVLNIDYGPFMDNATSGSQIYYRVHNGNNWVDSGDLFTNLVRVGGIYPSDINSGPIYIQRTDTATYPPSYNYKTTILLTLATL